MGYLAAHYRTYSIRFPRKKADLNNDINKN